MPRFRITSLVLLVAIVAVGLAAMRVASVVVERSVITFATLGILLGLTGAFARRSGAWIGFAVFSCGYLVILIFLGPNATDSDLFCLAVESVADRFNPTDLESPAYPKVDPNYLRTSVHENERNVLRVDYDDDAGTLSPTDRSAMKGYQQLLRAFVERRDAATTRNRHAQSIGGFFILLALGCLGAIVGRFFDKPRAAANIEQAITIRDEPSSKPRSPRPC